MLEWGYAWEQAVSKNKSECGRDVQRQIRVSDFMGSS